MSTTAIPLVRSTLSAYRMQLADRWRARLFELLGPTCAECGIDLNGVAWEVNHIYRRDWVPRTYNRYRRNLRYWREAQEGLVNLLCKECNLHYRPRELPPVRLGGSEDPY